MVTVADVVPDARLITCADGGLDEDGTSSSPHTNSAAGSDVVSLEVIVNGTCDPAAGSDVKFSVTAGAGGSVGSA
jgi:hypothetical protein